MVESYFVSNPTNEVQSKPIGVLASLAAGFDRVAARPILILPPLLLDLLLWFGPHLTISSLIPKDLSWLGITANGDPAISEQLTLFQQLLDLIRERFNLMGALSVLPGGMPFNLFVTSGSLPAGVPSLMAGRSPISTPLGPPLTIRLGDPLNAVLVWIMLTLLGLGFGVFYHRWLARQTAPEAELGSGWLSWGRMLLLYTVSYLGGLLILMVTVLSATFLGTIIPLLGTGLLLIGISLLFWIAIYFFFTAHGIVRFGLGLMRSMLESVYLVRANLLSTIGFVFLTFGITWYATTKVWVLPEEGSWYSLLALLGNAFVGATILTASYAFYQGRRKWLEDMQIGILEKLSKDQGSSKPIP